MPGVKGKSGRPTADYEGKVSQLRNILVDSVIEDCLKNPNRRLHWAESLKNSLLPKQQEISGRDGGPLMLNLDE